MVLVPHAPSSRTNRAACAKPSYGGNYGDRHFAAGGVTLVLEPYDLSVVFTLALHSHDVFVTITEGPIDDVANVLCDLDAYSATESRLGARATFAPDDPRLSAAGYEGVVVVDIGFWKPFEDAETERMIADSDCHHAGLRRAVEALRPRREGSVRVARAGRHLNPKRRTQRAGATG